MELPIDVLPRTNPPRFRWEQVVDTPNGRYTVEQEGALPSSVEVAVQRLVNMAKELMAENAGLKVMIKGLSDRVAAQSELLGKKAEVLVSAQSTRSVKKGRGVV